MSRPPDLKPWEKNECAYFKDRNCDRCRANWQIRVQVGEKPIMVYCLRMAADLIQAEADRLKTTINLEEIEKLLRVAIENDKVAKQSYIGDKKT